ncbi:periplasmic divalent cation tolerance protein cutA [Vibrio scophthalmi LMG 19158]|nr:periplasmic divalent cation tolerance protein cutA [Vibrio scophthalmi LMG 19158]
MPIESHYVWQDEVCIDEEWLLVMKTTQRCYQALEALIVEEHDYDTPQVVKLPFTEGFNPYLAWLDENTRR